MALVSIYSLISSQNNFHLLSKAVVKDIQELKQSLVYLTEAVDSLAEMAQQNCCGLDLAFLRDGGVCATLKEECCFFQRQTWIGKGQH